MCVKQYYNISICCNTYYCNTIYNMPEERYCTYIVTCVACKVVSIQFLHSKNNWTSCNVHPRVLLIYIFCLAFTTKNQFLNIQYVLYPKSSHIRVAMQHTLHSQAIYVCNMAMTHIISIVRSTICAFASINFHTSVKFLPLFSNPIL